MVTILLCKRHKGVKLCGFYCPFLQGLFSLSRENKNISDQTHAATGPGLTQKREDGSYSVFIIIQADLLLLSFT